MKSSPSYTRSARSLSTLPSPRFFLENKEPLEVDDSRLEEILSFFWQFLNGEITRPLEVAEAAKVSPAEKNFISIDKVKEVVKNSAFSDLLHENYGVEFSKLSYIIESNHL